MKLTRLVLGLSLFFLTLAFAPAAFGQRPPDAKVEIYIPRGMPISIEVTRDEKETRISKYHIKRIVGPEVDQVFMVSLTLGPDNKVHRGTGAIAENEARITTAKVWEPASIAWASTIEVRRLIIIVERVETSTGVWVVDNENGHIDLDAVADRGSAAIPGAKFIKNK